MSIPQDQTIEEMSILTKMMLEAAEAMQRRPHLGSNELRMVMGTSMRQFEQMIELYQHLIDEHPGDPLIDNWIEVRDRCRDILLQQKVIARQM